LIAKILAVVDAYDAITNDRPHSIARSSGAALDELMRCAGTHFDPQLVEVFARLMETQGEVAASEHAEALERTEASGRAEASERAKPSDRAI
jgi:HD-GYP domain-containing protein (c-di-GMP phosphodiesterase class II)